LIERYLNDPKPVLWRGAFQPRPKESPRENRRALLSGADRRSPPELRSAGALHLASGSACATVRWMPRVSENDQCQIEGYAMSVNA